MSCDLLEILCDLQHSRQAETRPVTLFCLGAPASCQQKESTAMVQHMKIFPLHVLVFLSFHLSLYVKERNLLSSHITE